MLEDNGDRLTANEVVRKMNMLDAMHMYMPGVA